MKRKITMVIMFAAIAMAAMARGGVTPLPIYCGERLVPIPSALGIIVLMAISACVVGVVIYVIKTVRSRKYWRILLDVIYLVILLLGNLWLFGSYLIAHNFFRDESIFTLPGMASHFKCKKCNSTFKESELTGTENAHFSAMSATIGGSGHYKYDCPKCSGWKTPERKPPRPPRPPRPFTDKAVHFAVDVLPENRN